MVRVPGDESSSSDHSHALEAPRRGRSPDESDHSLALEAPRRCRASDESDHGVAPEAPSDESSSDESDHSVALEAPRRCRASDESDHGVAPEAQSDESSSDESDHSGALEADPRPEAAAGRRTWQRGPGPPRKRPRREAPVREMVSHRSPAEHCFEWASIAMQTVAQELGQEMHARLGRRPWTFCSHFSGLGSLEVALEMLQAAYPPVDRARLRVESRYACEVTPQLRRVLESRVSGCVFKDVMGRMTGAVRHPRGGFEGMSFDDKVEAFRGATVSPIAECSKHGILCRVPTADVDVSGSPCQPWSTATCTSGVRGGRHRCAHLILAWSAIMRKDRPPLAIHENVRGLRKALLLQLLGDLYDIQQLSAEPAHAGFGFARRKRSYFVLSLRGRVATPSLAKLYARISSRLLWPAGAWPAWIWGAGPPELLEEENLARQRRGLDALEANPSADWTYLLTAKQQGYVDKYCAMASKRPRGEPEHVDARQDERCVFDLSQSPAHMGGGRVAELPVMRRSCCLLWSPARRRWMTARERAAVMGFPVTEELARIARVPQDVLTPTQASAIGNAMHVANLGIVILAVMASAEWS